MIESAVYGDTRGYFMKNYDENDLKKVAIEVHVVQNNQSMFTKGVLPGLYFQMQYPQSNLQALWRNAVGKE